MLRHRPSLTRTRIRLAAVGGAALLAASAAGTALASDSGGGAAASAKEPRLTGSAKMYRPAGDKVHFTFDAHGLLEKASGTFRFSHVFTNGRHKFAEGRIDCLISGGKVATATGIVEKTDLEGLKGKRVGFTVDDHGKRGDRLGYSWVTTNDPSKMKDLPPCMSSAPIEKLEKGDFTVAPWEPLG
ncbi:hypothetical protein [Streptomyces sp. ISL-11]|uniref:hypothetical protein n=1 Tax=Streptomyces sp. ISL-11 TaxID=2819174 RepID=UPI001BEC7DD4|nr:hypothetical protein [Streptomyces sp. ISL-11]MBT2386128.1 hypothetical protein [Streptomyces sp. ISL-11]